jgi:predicted ATPase
MLQSNFAVTSMFTVGDSDEVRASLRDSLRLADALGEDVQQLHLLAGLSISMTRSGNFMEAVAIGQRSIAIAQRVGTPSAVAVSEWMLGVAYHLAGDQVAGRGHIERGLTEAEGLTYADVNYFGYDHRVRALVALARCLWVSGFPDSAARTARLAIDESLKRNHPVDLCISMIYTTTVFIWRSDFAEAEQLIDRLIAHATRHGLAPYHTIGLGLTGELAIARGEPDVGVPILRQAIEGMEADQHYTLMPAFLGVLAEGLLQTGEVDEAASVIDGAIAHSDALAESLSRPDYWRIRGLVCLNAIPADLASAEQAFQRSLELARAQSALGQELRTAIELARVWSGQGKVGAAVSLLAGVRNRFTEGLETGDVKSADQILFVLAPE